MTTKAITVEDLSKAYRLGEFAERADTAVGALADVLRAPLRNFHRLRRQTGLTVDDRGDDVLWALRDVSFEVAEGEVVGVIGRNGAGKSTLLKILSRITEPTAGRAVIRGRVSSLLEVGTGFHPELSGRENIYMNGTILGMSKREIDSKFDEIVDFSGVERFLDTPTKRYSSGMQVRLAFAVAAHLEPEILIIDEVLAVGDTQFQAKCLGKMQDVATSGRTVLFVSHNLNAVRSLCKRCNVVEAGNVTEFDDTDEAIATYQELNAMPAENQIQLGRDNGADAFISAAIVAISESDLNIDVTATLRTKLGSLGCGFRVRAPDGTRVCEQGANVSNAVVVNPGQTATFSLRLREFAERVNGGDYLVDLWVSAPGIEKFHEVTCAGQVTIAPRAARNTVAVLTARRNGVSRIPVDVICTSSDQESSN
ncbi:ABC transporter ATP-binding protein [Botrimarina sp.]|uniref:ABC transporter ATP-binding protein n=1 Tax=Botrimarina sp. TaxID=2795802 RepID=UPI0032EE7B69